MALYLQKKFSVNEFFEKFKLHISDNDLKKKVYTILSNSSNIYVSTDISLHFFNIDLDLETRYRFSELANRLHHIYGDNKKIVNLIEDFFFDRLIKYNLNKFIIEFDKEVFKDNRSSFLYNENINDLEEFYELVLNGNLDFYYDIHFRSDTFSGKDYKLKALIYNKKRDLVLVRPYTYPLISLARVKIAYTNMGKIYKVLEDVFNYAFVLAL